MELLYEYAWLIPVLPLLGAMLVGLGLISFNKATNKLRQINAVVIVSLLGVAMGLSFALLYSQIQGHDVYTYTLEWASAGDFYLTMGYVIDPLTSVMLLYVPRFRICTLLFLSEPI